MIILENRVKISDPELFEHITFDDFNITVYFHSLLWTLCIRSTPIKESSKMIDLFLLFNLKIYLFIF